MRYNLVQMQKNERHPFAIKAECLIVKNNSQINNRKKSKFSLLTLNMQTKTLTIIPFGSNKQEESIEMALVRLKYIHKKFIEEGKITIEFFQKKERMSTKGIGIPSHQENVQISSQVFISQASKENLELLIKKIVQLRSPTTSTLANKQNQLEKKSDIESKKETGRETNKLNQMKKETLGEIVKITKKRPELISDDELDPIPLNRRDLIKNSMDGGVKLKKEVFENQKIERKHFDFLELPILVLNNIFEYCQFSLEHRQLSKRFSEFVLKNIISIRLKPGVDEFSFNKLCRWAINVDCRMKNVKNLDLVDRYDDQRLEKNKAKTLRFGEWKEMSSKNANQLKSLRIFCLEIPFGIKYDLSHLFGIRMVQLRLKSQAIITVRNQFIRSQDIASILKNIKELKVLQIPYVNSDLFPLIEFPKRLEELRIFLLNDNLKEKDWSNLTKFQHLKTLSICYFERYGIKQQNFQCQINLPNHLKQLEIGTFLCKEEWQRLPYSIQKLKLVGDRYLNEHCQEVKNLMISQLMLPELRELDITCAPNIRSEGFEQLYSVEVITNWSRDYVDQVSRYLPGEHHIKLLTIK